MIRLVCAGRQKGLLVRVLIVEDDLRLAEALRRGLSGDGFMVEVVHDGGSALSFLETGVFEVVVLDRDLPVLHGDIVARTLRDRGSSVRILMLTASGETAQRVAGLELGADDYLTKPFEYDELLARLRALGRRLRSSEGGFEFGGIRVDAASHQVWCDGESLSVRPKALAVLTELLRARGAVVSAAVLFDSVWGEDIAVDEAVVKTVIHTLRKKLGPSRIATLRGVGYRIVGKDA